MFISIKRCNFTFVFFKTACHANAGAERSFSGSGLYIIRHIFQKFLNTPANNSLSNYSFGHTNHDILLNSLFQNLYKLFFALA